MFAAIVAGFVALLVVAAILVAVYVVFRGRKTENVSVKRDVRSIQSVGVSSSLPDSHRVPAAGGAPAGTPAQPVANPGDNLKNRFTAMGVVAGLIFGTLATKLWSMQVLAGASFKKESEDNQYTTVYTPAPRGYILDADGNVIVKNRTSPNHDTRRRYVKARIRRSSASMRVLKVSSIFMRSWASSAVWIVRSSW